MEASVILRDERAGFADLIDVGEQHMPIVPPTCDTTQKPTHEAWVSRIGAPETVPLLATALHDSRREAAAATLRVYAVEETESSWIPTMRAAQSAPRRPVIAAAIATIFGR